MNGLFPVYMKFTIGSTWKSNLLACQLIAKAGKMGNIFKQWMFGKLNGFLKSMLYDRDILFCLNPTGLTSSNWLREVPTAAR